MFCTKCGKLNEDTAHFCGSCGMALTAPQPGYQASSDSQSVYQVQSWPVSPAWQAPEKVKVPGRGLSVFGLILSLLASILASFWEISAVFALLGIAVSALAQTRSIKAGQSNGLAVVALIGGIVALAMAVIFGLIGLDLFAAIPDPGKDYSVYM